MKVDIVCLGELLIDMISLDRGTSLVDSLTFRKAAGGAPANVAAGIAKLGLTAGFLGKVGDDPFGRYLKGTLDDVGVDTSCLALDDNARTSMALISEKVDGTKDCMFYRNPGADMLLSEEDIDERYIAGARIFHFGSISLGSPLSKKATLKALEYSGKHGLIISYDPNLRPALWNDAETARKEILTGFDHADIVKISDEEYGFITGKDSAESCAAYILDKGPRIVIVTLGSRGCYYSDGKKSGYLQGFPVDVVETTGAGDAFVAAVLFNLSLRLAKGDRDLSIDEEMVGAFIFANAAGALSTTKAGAIPSLPSYSEVMSLLSK